jgi:hydrogenase maturation protease
LNQGLHPDLIRDLACDSSTREHHLPILLIGYGNPLRSDDGIGWRVAREIRARVDSTRMGVVECRQLVPEMAERIRSAKLVIFVDAAAEGFPGEVRHHRLDDHHVEDSSTAFSHGATPEALVALTRELYAAAPEVHLFTVSGGSFGHGESFSAEVEGVLPLVVSEVSRLITAAENGIPSG